MTTVAEKREIVKMKALPPGEYLVRDIVRRMPSPEVLDEWLWASIIWLPPGRLPSWRRGIWQ